jgi:iron complex outermembrane recepter protein
MVCGNWGEKSHILLAVGVISMLMVQPAQADSNMYGDRSAALLAQNSNVTVIQVTGVEANPTEQGVEVILQTTQGEQLQITNRSAEKNFVVDVPNARLLLPSGDAFTFSTKNPVEGITEISVINLNNNTIRVTVTGAVGVPVVELFDSPEGLIFSIAGAVASTPSPQPEPEEALTQNEQPNDIELIVTATRTAQNPQDVPRSVTIINREQIQDQTNLTNDVRDILGRLVPGFGPPVSESTPRSIVQNLRGRSAAILVDGVPLTSNYGLDRELRTIDPNQVERIEIVRGPTAIYGGQATGGVINIITRRQANQPLQVTLNTGLNLSLTNPQDSFGNRQTLSISGQNDNIDYLFSLSRENNGGFFDAEGDRIPETSGGGIIDADAYSILAKVGATWDDVQRLQFSFDFYDARQDTRFFSDPSIRNIPGIQKARPLAVNLDREGTDLAGDRNLLLNLNYTHEDVWGSKFQAQAYYRDYTSIVGFSDFRGGFFNVIGRQRAMGDKWGGRLQLNTPVITGAEVLWGLDYVRENNKAPFEIFDPEAFDNNNTLRKVGERTFVPEHILSQLGLFAQLQWEMSDRVSVSGGLRHERIGLEVDDYTTFFGRQIEGGDRNFNATVFNLGSVYKLTPQLNVFANFAQGFSVPSFGGVLRNPPPAFVSVQQNLQLTEPVKVNNYELGLRGNWPGIQASIAAFYNTSSLGEGYTFVGGVSQLVRAPERLYGIEATLDTQINNFWQLGGTVSWTEGESDEENDGNFLPISSFRVQPLKLTAYLEHQTTPNWQNRLQFLYVGGRDRAFNADVDRVKITDYFLVDYISNVQLGGGTLSIGIQNLLNTQYFPVQSQFLSSFNEIFNAAGSGRTFRLGYSIRF